MKPFNLEAAQRGEALITREGEFVKFICIEYEADVDTRLLVLRNGRVLPLFTDGTYNGPSGGLSSVDLFMAPKKRTVWVNFFPNGEAFYHDSEEAAIAGRKNFYDEDVALGCKPSPVEIEE